MSFTKLWLRLTQDKKNQENVYSYTEMQSVCACAQGIVTKTY